MSELGFFNLTNHRPHPTQRDYVVFNYTNAQMADYFEELLNENKIPYERGSDHEVVKRHLFGVRRNWFDEANRLNNIAIGKYRKPFIADKLLRYFILGFVFFIIILGLLGYLNSR